MRSPGLPPISRKTAIVGSVVVASCAVECFLYSFALSVVRSDSDGNSVVSEGLIIWIFLNVMIFAPVLGIIQMAGNYWTHRQMRQQGRESVSGWCDLERTEMPAAVQSGAPKTPDHPMRDRELDG
jgi:hypothetical protein